MGQTVSVEPVGSTGRAEPFGSVPPTRSDNPEGPPGPDVPPDADGSAGSPGSAGTPESAGTPDPDNAADAVDAVDAEAAPAQAKPAAKPASAEPAQVGPADAGGPVGRRNVYLDPGTTVGTARDCRWRILRHLAEGGFASVYEVRPATRETEQAHGAQHRALKCLWGTPAELSQLNGEADRMAAVEGHDNVLGLVTSFRFDRIGDFSPHHVGLVLELAGEDLYRFGERLGPSEHAWAAVFEQVAAGLEHIHARRIVHGDIKPTNLLRVGPRFTIADFGLSAPLETTRSAGIGWARTISFWPPESGSQGVRDANGVRRAPAEGWRATQMGDVWALAVSMHRLLTGRHIAASSNPERQYELVCAGRYTIDDRLGPGWRRLLSDCLVHDPGQRVVTTAADLRRRLAELAVPEDYQPVFWRQGQPRLAALVDGVTDEQVLVFYLDQEGGRAQSLFASRGDLLLDVARHLHHVVVPSLAQQVRDSQRAAVRLAELQERMGHVMAEAANNGLARTRVLPPSEAQRGRQLAVAVAEVTRQRDQAARDRDRAVRERDQAVRDRDQAIRRNDVLTAERDRLAQRHADLSYRLELLERERSEERAAGYRPPAGSAPVAPATPVARVLVQRRSLFGRLVRSLLVILVGAVVGALLASQILYDDAWAILSRAVDAISSTTHRH